MSFSETDLELFAFIKSNYLHMQTGRSALTNYVLDAELLWTGKHYLLVRTGNMPDVGREVIIYSREWALMRKYRNSGNSMMAIAVAALDPIHNEWEDNWKRDLHSSRGSWASVPEFKGRRWGKALRADVIAWCERHDASFEDRKAEAIKTRAGKHAFSQAVCGFVKDNGLSVNGTVEQYGVPYPCGHTYSFRLAHYVNSSGKVQFSPTWEDKVSIRLHNMELNKDEFEILVKALGEIHNNRCKAGEENHAAASA